MPRKSRPVVFVGGVFLLLVPVLGGCGGDPFTYCSSEAGVASFTLQFANGLDNFSEDQYAKLRSQTADVLRVLEAARSSADKEVSTSAKNLTLLTQDFQKKMDSFSWDVSQAVLDTSTNEIASRFSTAEVLKEANLIESFVIDTCGMPSTIAITDQVGDTLPLPSFPSPTDTDPTTNTINENSEDVSIGTTVANLFQLTLTQSQVKCLGNALKGVYDSTSRYSSSGEYQSQFQAAFDLCEINFVVPAS